MSKRLGTPEIIVADTGHAAGRRLRDYGSFGDPASEKTAVLIECGQHWEADAAPVAIDSVYRWLLIHDMIDAEIAEPNLCPLGRGKKAIR